VRPLSSVKLGPPMRFRRFTISGSYIFQEKRRGSSVNFLEDCAHEWLKGFLKPFADACIYLPVDKQEYVVAAKELLLNGEIPCPGVFHATTQYLVNSQLYYIARRAASSRWSVEREVNYGVGSNYRSDLKIIAIPDEDEEHKPFTIWFESDNADVKTLKRKFGERIPVMGASDSYISFIYANSEKKWSHVENAASRLYHEMNRHVDAGTCRNSLGILRIDAPNLYKATQDLVINAHLMLDGSSVRVAEFHFGSNSSVLNEWVIDENGTRYPHRDPPPPLPKFARLLGLRRLLENN
jgi:hypothetical protein